MTIPVSKVLNDCAHGFSGEGNLAAALMLGELANRVAAMEKSLKEIHTLADDQITKDASDVLGDLDEIRSLSDGYQDES